MSNCGWSSHRLYRHNLWSSPTASDVHPYGPRTTLAAHCNTRDCTLQTGPRHLQNSTSKKLCSSTADWKLSLVRTRTPSSTSQQRLISAPSQGGADQGSKQQQSAHLLLRTLKLRDSTNGPWLLMEAFVLVARVLSQKAGHVINCTRSKVTSGLRPPHNFVVNKNSSGAVIDTMLSSVP